MGFTLVTLSLLWAFFGFVLDTVIGEITWTYEGHICSFILFFLPSIFMIGKIYDEVSGKKKKPEKDEKETEVM